MHFPRTHLKHVLKHGVGLCAAACSRFAKRSAQPEICILTYHRVARITGVDPGLDNWNVSPERFRRQVEYLSKEAEIVSLAEWPKLWNEGKGTKPRVILSFDDGYQNFHDEVLPVLQEFQVPACLFVVTRYIGSEKPFPFDRWGRKYCHSTSPDTWQPINWEALQACHESGLVLLGSHSHQHFNGLQCPERQLEAEADKSKHALAERLGINEFYYAYPYGSTRLGQVSPSYVSAVKQAGYKLALTSDLGMASAESDPHLLPRVEAHGLDSSIILKAKITGHLKPYRLTDRLRLARRNA